MVISKVKNEFNTYKIELSMGELKAFYDLTRGESPDTAVVDEVRSNLEWYFKRLPPPGAEPDAEKKADAVEQKPAVELPDPGEITKGDQETLAASIGAGEGEAGEGEAGGEVDLDAGQKVTPGGAAEKPEAEAREEAPEDELPSPDEEPAETRRPMRRPGARPAEEGKSRR
jgi:hypothetical protein